MGWQGSFNGLSFGAGTVYGISRLRWFQRDVAMNTPDLPRYHGGLVGASYELPHTVEIDMEITGDGSTLGDRLDAVLAAFQPQIDTELPLIFTMPGQAARRVTCRPLTVDAPLTPADDATDHVQAFIRLVASDPVTYANTETTLVVSPYTSPSGFTWDAVWPIQWGAGGSGGGATVTVGGQFPTWPMFTITGPSSGTLTNPQIEWVTGGEALRLTANGGVGIATGQVLEIDSHPARRSVAFQSGATRYGRLSSDSVWFRLPPGSNEFRFRASGSTAGATCTVTLRDAWI